MVENLGRKFTLIFSLIAIAVIALSVGGFRLGLDLQGGTRLVYSFDLEKAAAEGKIQETELLDPLGLLNEVIEILRERLDPTASGSRSSGPRARTGSSSNCPAVPPRYDSP